MDPAEFEEALRLVCSKPQEEEWFEFKINNWRPDELGENLSAVANMAAFRRINYGYVIFGVEDGTHKIVGTSLNRSKLKVGNQDILVYLTINLSPRPELDFDELTVDGKTVYIFRIKAAAGQPIAYKGKAMGRLGSSTTDLVKNLPHIAAAIWSGFNNITPFDRGIAEERLKAEEILAYLDTEHFFRMSNIPKPTTTGEIMSLLRQRRIIDRDENLYSITNVGALLLANKIEQFPSIQEKSVRVLHYSSIDKLDATFEYTGKKGYAVGLDGLIEYVQYHLPKREVYINASRQIVNIFPTIALREFIANALIHQDFNITGKRPVISIYPNRIEITNPGIPIIPALRFIDDDKSRNERLATLMRELTYCEQRGSGIDKALWAMDLHSHLLPPPNIIVGYDSTSVVLKGPQNFSDISTEDRIRGCFYHCVLQWTKREKMTNETLRARFKLNKNQYQIASAIISDTIESHLIKDADIGSSKRYKAYVPVWA